jgi:hypothetical protein
MPKKTRDLDKMAVQAMRDAFVKVVAENRRRRMPLALWRAGKVVLVPASKVRLRRAEKARR